MSEDSGKRGLRAFLDWVEKGPDWDDEAGVHEGGAGGHGEADTVHASDQAVKRNTKRTMGRRFAEFTEEHALRVFGRVYRAVAQIVCLAGMAVLLMMVTHLPCAVNPKAGTAGGKTREGERSMKRMRKEISYWNRWPGCWFPSFLCLASMWCSTAICPPEAGSQEER